MKLLVF